MLAESDLTKDENNDEYREQLVTEFVTELVSEHFLESDTGKSIFNYFRIQNKIRDSKIFNFISKIFKDNAEENKNMVKNVLLTFGAIFAIISVFIFSHFPLLLIFIYLLAASFVGMMSVILTSVLLFGIFILTDTFMTFYKKIKITQLLKNKYTNEELLVLYEALLDKSYSIQAENKITWGYLAIEKRDIERNKEKFKKLIIKKDNEIYNLFSEICEKIYLKEEHIVKTTLALKDSKEIKDKEEQEESKLNSIDRTEILKSIFNKD